MGFGMKMRMRTTFHPWKALFALRTGENVKWQPKPHWINSPQLQRSILPQYHQMARAELRGQLIDAASSKLQVQSRQLKVLVNKRSLIWPKMLSTVLIAHEFLARAMAMPHAYSLLLRLVAMYAIIW